MSASKSAGTLENSGDTNILSAFSGTEIMCSAVVFKFTNSCEIGFMLVGKLLFPECSSFVKTTKQGLFKEKEEYSIDLTKKAEFDNHSEERIFNIMYEASADGILEPNEFKNWTIIFINILG